MLVNNRKLHLSSGQQQRLKTSKRKTNFHHRRENTATTTEPTLLFEVKQTQIKLFTYLICKEEEEEEEEVTMNGSAKEISSRARAFKK